VPQPFPHLLPAEGIIWYKFLVKYGAGWDRFEYDVRLGGGRPADPSWPPEIAAMAQRLSLKRVDAVGFRGTWPTIFEVSPRGARTVVGALELYAWLYHQAFPQYGVPERAAVVGAVDPDVLAYLQAHGDRVYVVGDT
jgi:hypothetical protein